MGLYHRRLLFLIDEVIEEFILFCLTEARSIVGAAQWVHETPRALYNVIRITQINEISKNSKIVILFH